MNGHATPHTSSRRHRHVVLLTYEFTYAPFSGNGLLARSVVKSLLRQDVQVTVWCCRPSNDNNNNGNKNTNHHHHLQTPELTAQQYENLKIISTVVHNGWKRLDRHSCWEEFRYDRLEENDRILLKNILVEDNHRHNDTIVQCAMVDWTGGCAWRTIPEKLRTPRASTLTYLNFRIFALGQGHSQDKDWYEEKEKCVLQDSKIVVALSNVDRDELLALLPENRIPPDSIHVLQPPLRADIQELAVKYKIRQEHKEAWNIHLPEPFRKALHTIKNDTPRSFLTCLVRLSPEKEAIRFAHFVQQSAEVLAETNMIPVLVGAEADATYAHQVQSKLKSAFPGSVIVSHFLDPPELAALLSHSRLNFHPCAYDAFGMTIIEAAAFGVPSIVADGGHVGATSLLGDQAYIPAHMSEAYEGVPGMETLQQLMLDSEALEAIGERARGKALAWDQDAYGVRLVSMLEGSYETT